MVESAFELAVPKPITDEGTKYNYCVSHLSPYVAVAIQHQLPSNVQSILDTIEPNTAQKDAEVAYCILVVTPVQVCAVLKSSNVNSDVSGETELLKESLNLPYVCKKTFRTHELKLLEAVKYSCDENMKAASKEVQNLKKAQLVVFLLMARGNGEAICH
ncbi:hypothetical protein AVEN_71104-1 [Araneus ventricosus]|uniref:Uncharacterized protein n=1 Tax=Araneus ventricosus TaxID=182803 RepID=A0A4Y2HJ44_ARAVE|nr:hypothetical protein AVEN_71104-1 [Araneus ventricosus]